MGWTNALKRRPYASIGTLSVLAHLALALYRNQSTYFFADDFQHLILAAGNKGNLRHLLEPVFGQYVPLYRATNVVFLQVFGLNYLPMLLSLVVASSASVASIMWLCARAKLALLPTALLGAFLACTWLPIEGQQWWSAGLHILPGAAALCFCLAVAAAPAKPLSKFEKLMIAAAYGVGIAYYNATLLILGPLVMVRWYIRSREAPDAGFWSRAGGVIADLAPAVAVAALAILSLLVLSPERPPVAGNMPNVAEGVAVGVVYGLGAQTLGVRQLSEATSALELALWGILGTALLAGTTIASILRASRTAWLWLGFWAFVLLQLWIIGLERVSPFGPWILASPRYNLSNMLMFVGIAVIAFGERCPRQFVEQRSVRQGALTQIPIYTGVIAAAAIIMAHALNGASYPRKWEQPAARAFMDNLRRTAPGSALVGNRTLPNFVTQHWTGVFATLSQFLSVSPKHIQLASWSEATHVVCDDGSLKEIALLPTEQWTFPGERQIRVQILPTLDAAGEVNSIQHSRQTILSGWESPILQKDVSSDLIAVTPKGEVLLAIRRQMSTPYLLPRFQMAEFGSAGFSIELPQGMQPQNVRVFLLLNGALAVPISAAGRVEESFDASVDLHKIGNALSVVEARKTDAFTENGWFPSLAAAPLPGSGYGSYAALGDAGRGEVTIDFSRPGTVLTIAIPIATGPSAHGVRFSVIDPANNVVLAKMENPSPLMQWYLWTVDLPASFAGEKISVKAEDTSDEWGSWAAIGPVYAVKQDN